MTPPPEKPAGRKSPTKATGGKPPGRTLPGTACPICGKPAVETYKPFCSGRCADIDLHRWLSGAYVIPASDQTDEDGDAAPLAPDAPEER